MSSSLAVVPTQETDIFAGDRLKLIRDKFANGAPQHEFELFVEVCRTLNLDPLQRQVYLIPRNAKQRDGSYAKSWTIQTSIDGYRALADRTGAYAGSDDAVFAPAGTAQPQTATVTVWKIVQGIRCPFTATARWDEYNDDRGPMWKKMPHTMLAKCFDEETEVLTHLGFQPFSRVTGVVMMVTDNGLEPTDARPFSQPWDGNMVTLQSDDLNFSVTPNHDMLTTEGKIEAGAMFARATARPKFWIPRTVAGTHQEFDISDQELRIAAAYLADGSDRVNDHFIVEVSRPAKVDLLREIGGYEIERERVVAGKEARTAVRTITTRTNKRSFVYGHGSVSLICGRGKRVWHDALLSLSRRQARLFVDTWVAFDGHTNKRSGVRRFYSSRIDHIEAFELACVIAGYAVSPRTARSSDISSRPNYNLTVSGRSEIPVIRWGREYKNLSTGNAKKRTGLEITPNTSGRVWCVTVPSGVIVVRRNGFSMLCGNCAESLALRKAFPAQLSGVYTDSEMEQAGPVVREGRVVDVSTGETIEAQTREVAPHREKPPERTPDEWGRTISHLGPIAQATEATDDKQPSVNKVCKDAGLTEEATRRYIHARANVESRREMTGRMWHDLADVAAADFAPMGDGSPPPTVDYANRIAGAIDRAELDRIGADMKAAGVGTDWLRAMWQTRATQVPATAPMVDAPEAGGEAGLDKYTG